MAGRVRSSRSRVRGEMEVKYRWKKMVCRMAEWSGQVRSGQVRSGQGRADGGDLRTFDDVLDVGPVGYYLEHVLWWTAGFHSVGCILIGV